MSKEYFDDPRYANLLSERHAEQQWCPLARIRYSDGAYNRIEYQDGSSFDVAASAPCIGSLCMAWREAVKVDGQMLGYCGAFGKVEVDE